MSRQRCTFFFPFPEEKIFIAITHRHKLAQLHTRLSEYLGRLLVHTVPVVVHHLADAYLADLDAARQTRARVAVQHRALTDPLPAGLQQGVLLGVDAQARGQADTRGVAVVAAGAAALAAVA